MIARLVLSVLLATTASLSGWQPAVSITDYGTYSAVVVVEGNWVLHRPVSIASVDELKHLTTTTTIVAQDGTYWGMHVSVENPSDRSVKVVCKITHPPITTPDGKTTTEDDSPPFDVNAGQTAVAESIWFFIKECPYEFVPGKWTMRVTVDGNAVATKEFNVVKPDPSSPK